MAFRPIDILTALNRHAVAYIVIGGIAAATHGSPSVTNDLDICYERSRANLDRLAAALAALDARLRGVDADVPFILDGHTLAAGDHFTFVTKFGDFDCLGTPAGTTGYADLRSGAELFDLGDLAVWFASVADLIRMKTAAGRPKDRVELEILGALRDEIS